MRWLAQSPNSRIQPDTQAMWSRVSTLCPTLSALLKSWDHYSLGSWEFMATGCETRWDLGPFAAACTWPHLSWGNKIQRNCMGLKITVCMHHGGQFQIQKIQRDQNPQLPHFLRSLEQKQGVGRKNMPPAHTTTYWVSKPPKPPLQFDPWTHLDPYPV